MTWIRFIRRHPWESVLPGVCLAVMLLIAGDGIWTHQAVVLAIGGIGSLFVLATFAIVAALM